MSKANTIRVRFAIPLRTIAHLIVVLGTLAFPGGVAVAGGAGDFVLPGSEAASAGGCVEDTEFMRRNHFEVIRHQRDETVYGGIRSSKHSLAGCVGCHVVHAPAGEPVPISDQGQFCAACHAYAAVKMNCFDCHATVPEGDAWNQSVTKADESPEGSNHRQATTGLIAGADGPDNAPHAAAGPAAND